MALPPMQMVIQVICWRLARANATANVRANSRKRFTAFIAVYIDSCVSFETERVDGWNGKCGRRCRCCCCCCCGHCPRPRLRIVCSFASLFVCLLVVVVVVAVVVGCCSSSSSSSSCCFCCCCCCPCCCCCCCWHCCCCGCCCLL
jgi:hypothetical protein